MAREKHGSDLSGRVQTIRDQQSKQPAEGECTCPHTILCRPVDEKLIRAILEATAKENPCPRHSP